MGQCAGVDSGRQSPDFDELTLTVPLPPPANSSSSRPDPVLRSVGKRSVRSPPVRYRPTGELILIPRAESRCRTRPPRRRRARRRAWLRACCTRHLGQARPPHRRRRPSPRLRMASSGPGLGQTRSSSSAQTRTAHHQRRPRSRHARSGPATTSGPTRTKAPPPPPHPHTSLTTVLPLIPGTSTSSRQPQTAPRTDPRPASRPSLPLHRRQQRQQQHLRTRRMGTRTAPSRLARASSGSVSAPSCPCQRSKAATLRCPASLVLDLRTSSPPPPLPSRPSDRSTKSPGPTSAST